MCMFSENVKTKILQLDIPDNCPTNLNIKFHSSSLGLLNLKSEANLPIICN